MTIFHFDGTFWTTDDEHICVVLRRWVGEGDVEVEEAADGVEVVHEGSTFSFYAYKAACQLGNPLYCLLEGEMQGDVASVVSRLKRLKDLCNDHGFGSSIECVEVNADGEWIGEEFVVDE